MSSEMAYLAGELTKTDYFSNTDNDTDNEEEEEEEEDYDDWGREEIERDEVEDVERK